MFVLMLIAGFPLFRVAWTNNHTVIFYEKFQGIRTKAEN